MIYGQTAESHESCLQGSGDPVTEVVHRMVEKDNACQIKFWSKRVTSRRLLPVRIQAQQLAVY